MSSIKTDLLTVGAFTVAGALTGGAYVGVRRFKKAYMSKEEDEDAPSDYVTMTNNNDHFKTLNRFIKEPNEKKFARTLRHRVSRLLKLAYNEDGRYEDTEYWSRLGVIHLRAEQALNLITTIQYLVKERYGPGPLVGFDEAIQEIRQIVDDIRHNNVLLGSDA